MNACMIEPMLRPHEDSVERARQFLSDFLQSGDLVLLDLARQELPGLCVLHASVISDSFDERGRSLYLVGFLQIGNLVSAGPGKARAAG